LPLSHLSLSLNALLSLSLKVEAAAEAAQILSFIRSLPDSWNTVVGERGLKLSGGEKQRVAIARCLLKDPPVVVLDEATSALDAVTEHSVQQAINVLAGDKRAGGIPRTVIIIAHRLATIREADQVVVLEAGEVAERGSHEELVARERGLYRRLWEMQMQSRG